MSASIEGRLFEKAGDMTADGRCGKRSDRFFRRRILNAFWPGRKAISGVEQPRITQAEPRVWEEGTCIRSIITFAEVSAQLSELSAP